MSRHEGVSCDSCLKGNFRGKRYKCLICYDYDLCATCYDAGATNTRHTTDHPMQCILTRMDFDLYYGGEAISIEQPQAFTCPFCGKMGFTETSLQDHVTAEHSDTSFEVVCPICAALPGGEPNHVTDDFASHLTLEHRSPRDLDEPTGSRHVRRVPQPSRGIGSGARSRRAHMQFSSSTGLATLSQGGTTTRDSMDPITELLSQLSGTRRATANLTQPNTTSQLHQLQMQLQLERQQAQAARQQLERLPRRQGQVTTNSAAVAAATAAYSNQSQYTILLESSPSPPSNANNSQFLLSRCTEPTLTESEHQALEADRSDRSLFIQELILSTLSEELPSSESWENLTQKLSQLTAAESSYFPDSDFASAPTTPKDFAPMKEAIGSSMGATSCDSSSHTSASNVAAPTCALAVQQPIVLRPSSIVQSNSHPTSSASSFNSTGQRSGSRKSAGSRAMRSNATGNNANGNVSAMGQLNLPQPMGGRGSGSSSSGSRTREGLNLGGGGGRSSGRPVGGRESTSPSSARRKVPRQVEDRNKSSEPPPPH